MNKLIVLVVAIVIFIGNSCNVFNGTNDLQDKEKLLFTDMQDYWENMYRIDSSKRRGVEPNRYISTISLRRFLFIDSIMHVHDFLRDSYSERFVRALGQAYWGDKDNVYQRMERKHNVEVLSITRLPNQRYQDTIEYQMAVNIDGNISYYTLYEADKLANVPPEDKVGVGDSWEYLIPFDIDLFWNLYKDEPRVCELLANKFHKLTTSLYRREQDYLTWLLRMIQYHDSDFARQKLCSYSRSDFNSMKKFDYRILEDSVFITDMLNTELPSGIKDVNYYKDCVDNLFQRREQDAARKRNKDERRK